MQKYFEDVQTRIDPWEAIITGPPTRYFTKFDYSKANVSPLACFGQSLTVSKFDCIDACLNLSMVRGAFKIQREKNISFFGSGEVI